MCVGWVGGPGEGGGVIIKHSPISFLQNPWTAEKGGKFKVEKIEGLSLLRMNEWAI